MYQYDFKKEKLRINITAMFNKSEILLHVRLKTY